MSNVHDALDRYTDAAKRHAEATRADVATTEPAEPPPPPRTAAPPAHPPQGG